jgi:succinyl-CoA synthetase beta subunit
VYLAEKIGGDRWAVKAQIHSGARGKAGGVKLCANEDEVREAATDLLGSKLVTHQTGPEGKIVHRIYVESAVPIERELYISLVLDRQVQRIIVVASSEGGTEIEELSQNAPESILREIVEPAVGMQGFQARELAFKLGLAPAQLKQATNVILGAYRAFRDLDATMVEINPLVITQTGAVLALDIKMSFDDNALFRHPEVRELRDHAEEDSREAEAEDHGMNYITLDGNIACIVNGAGLAMATMDLIKHHGGEPANFSDERVRAVLVNIFAGINRCDWVAQGIIQAASEMDVSVPIVVRLAGTNVEEGREMLTESELPITAAEGLSEAAQSVLTAMAGTSSQ